MLSASTLLDLASGAATTVAVSVSAIAFGVPLGLLLALGRCSRFAALRVPCAVYASLVRAVPVVTFVMLIFFGLPALGLSLNPLPAAFIALTLNTASFNSEIWRAAILDFPRGQLDSARAFGMTRFVSFRDIVFPQIWRASLPSLVNEMTLLIKASPAVAIIGVVDLTRKARQIAATTYEPLPPFLAAAVIYGVALILLVIAARMLERGVRVRLGRI
ncbi:MAG TPA: amino acid ABC transporter permease [Casimicrobiaceae bacterium]|nr:amino acid ABC transporter permease [Casimicrobiaceae bacterium]